ncbi:MAG TPA: dihydroorotase [Solirubrobacteraceae bacterium]|nr:dihydroorotase [Solirubrobacteraceae bacterium]
MSGAPQLTTAARDPASVLFSDVRALDPRAGIQARCDLLVSHGEIAAIGEPGTISPGEDAELIDGRGELQLFPAFFDPHVHLRVPGQEHKEDLETGTRAAAAGGFCAVIAMPNTDPPIDSAPILRSLHELAAQEARVAVGFLPAISKGLRGAELTEMVELRAAGALGFSDDGRPVADAGLLRDAMRYQRLAGGVLALHEEELSLAAGGVMREGPTAARLGLRGIPALAEATMVARDAALALAEDARVHFQHLSCEGSLAALAAHKSIGAQLSAEVTPHHLLLCDEDLLGLETALKVNPPLASAADRSALRSALREGLIDCIATDHAPHAREEKEVPIEQAPFGSTGLETAFAALYSELVLPGELALSRLIEALTAGAELFGLPVPTIARGAPANLALVDLQAHWVAGEQGWESRAANCCLAGRPLRGRVLMTLAGGTVAYRERSFAMVAL